MGQKDFWLLSLLGLCLSTTSVKAAENESATQAVVVVEWGMRMALQADPKARPPAKSRKLVALTIVQSLSRDLGPVTWRLLAVAPQPLSFILPAKPVWLAGQNSRQLASKRSAPTL